MMGGKRLGRMGIMGGIDVVDGLEVFIKCRNYANVNTRVDFWNTIQVFTGYHHKVRMA